MDWRGWGGVVVGGETGVIKVVHLPQYWQEVLRMLFRYWPQPEAAITKLMLSYQTQFYSSLLAFSAQCEIYNDPPQNPPQITAVLEQWTNPETIIANEVRVKTPAEAGRADKHGLTEETRRLARDKIQLLLGPISLIFLLFFWAVRWLWHLEA